MALDYSRAGGLGDFSGLQAGTNINIDLTDPLNPIINVINNPTFSQNVTIQAALITPLSNNLASLTTVEVTQLLNIDTTTINATQWGYLGELDQSIIQAATPTFAGLTINGNIAVTGTVDGIDIATRDTLLSTTITDLDGFPDELKNLVTAEIQQLETIGTTTIIAAQWGYLGELDQSLIQASSPTFAGLTITNPINEFSIDGTLIGNSDTAIPTEKAVKTYVDAIIAGDIAIDLLGSPTYTSIQDLIKTTLSAGRTSGGTITAHDPLDGTIDISTGTGFIKTTDNEVGDTKSFDFPAKSSLALVDNDTNYIYVDYAAGSPEVKTTLDRSTINGHTQFTLGRVYREGTDLHIVNTGTNLAGFIHHNHERLILVRGFERASGGVVSETGTRNIALTAGVFFLGANKHENPAQDTSDTDTFTYWHRDGVGGWTKTAAQTQIDNLRYDDGDGTLGNLTPSRYGVHWVFIHYDGDMQVIYGQGNYKITDAENATVPTGLPEELSSFSVLASKIIIQQNTASFSSAVTAYETLFPVSAPSAHNDLSLLQGGTGDEYYHLDLTEFNFLDGIDQAIKTTDDVTFNQLTLGAGNLIVGAVQLTNTQWGYLGALTEDVQTFMDTFGTITNTPSIDQSLLSTSTPTFSIVNLTSSLNIEGITDSVININATDDGWAYLSFKHSGVRKAYFGIDSTPDLHIVAEAGDISISGTEIKLTGTIITANSSNLGSLTTVEVTQLLNIDTSTISIAQWGYLGAVTEDIQTHMSSILNPHSVSASDVGLGNVDNIANINQTTLGTVVSGNIDAIANYYVLTNDLTSGEITQLQAIDTITITNAQWGYLGALDQSLTQASSPTFAGLTLTGNIVSSASRAIQLNNAVADTTLTIENTDLTFKVNLDVEGNIIVGGLVDGIDIATRDALLSSTITDLDGFPDELKNLDTAEIQQLETIGLTTIIAAQWGYLGALDQSLTQASSPTFAGLTLTGNIVSSASRAIQLNNAVADTTLTIENTDLTFKANLDVEGNIIVGGLVDGIDIATRDALLSSTITDLDGFPDELKSLAAIEITQLLNIDTSTISALQWGYLGAVTEDIQTHMSSVLNPHTVTATQVGLGNVDNLSDANQVSLGTVTSGNIDAIANYYVLTNDLTAGEITQLQNIDTSTISIAQWGILGGLATTLTATELNWMDGVTSSVNTHMVDTTIHYTQANITTVGALASGSITTGFTTISTSFTQAKCIATWPDTYPISTSGNRFGVAAVIAADGVMEIGKYIDFHETDADATDYSVRLTSTSNVLYVSGALVLGGNSDFGNYNITARNFNADTTGSVFQDLTVPYGHTGTSWGLTQEIALAVGDDGVAAGRIRIFGKTASGGGSILATTVNLHIDAIGGHIYFGHYDASDYLFQGTGSLRCHIITSNVDTDHKIEMDPATDAIYIHPGDISTDNYIMLKSTESTGAGIASDSPIIQPNGYNKGSLGVAATYWRNVYAYNVRYKSLGAFDSFDDLTVIETIDYQKDELGEYIKTPEGDLKLDKRTIIPELIEDDPNDPDTPFVKAESMQSLLRGAIKQLHQKVKEQEILISKITARLDTP